jgi:hypothetical protein
MKKVLAILCVLAAVAAFGKERREPGADTSRPLMHFRYIVGVVPAGEATDVYWESENELVEPTRSVLFRTRIGADGLPQGSTTVVRETEGYAGSSVGSTGSSAMAMWKSDYYEIRASPLVDGRLLYPEGKFIADGLYAGMQCAADECLVGWDSGKQTPHRSIG